MSFAIDTTLHAPSLTSIVCRNTVKSNRLKNVKSVTLIVVTVTTLLVAVTSVHPIFHTVLMCALLGFLYIGHSIEPITEGGDQDNQTTVAMHEEHQLLLESIRHYPMPYAIYDKKDRLVVWNQHYESIYAHAFGALKDKAKTKQLYYRDLIHSNAKETMSGQTLADYTDLRVANQRLQDGAVSDHEYPNRGWYRVSKYTTPSGGVAGFAIDINELKQREQELMQEVERRKKLEVKILKLANTDALTGIANRRHFIDRVEVEFQRAQQGNKTLCVMMLDIDHFKTVNDTYGHAAGDEVIATVATMAEAALPLDTDLIGRLGGEEFAVLLQESSEEVGYQVAERIRQSIKSLSFLSDGYTFGITISVGIAYFTLSDINSAALIKRADNALYCAKAGGRNRVETADNNDANDALATG